MSTRVRHSRVSRALQRLVVDDGQEGMIDLETAIVFDEPELLEPIHKDIQRERVEPIISGSVS